MRVFRHLFGLWTLAAAALVLSGCAVVGNVTQLDDDWYRVVHVHNDSLTAAWRKRPLYVQQHADTLLLTPRTSVAVPLTYRYPLQPNHQLLLSRSRFDLDVFTIPVKLRPPQGGVPVQLNTNFNAAVYLGRRLDFYALRTRRSTPFGPTARIRATGLGYGAFVGAGSTLVNADVTRQRTTAAEYEGLVLHGGLAAIYDARVFNVGLALGFDQLMGPEGRYWVYQHKPWVGVLFGLDLN